MSGLMIALSIPFVMLNNESSNGSKRSSYLDYLNNDLNNLSFERTKGPQKTNLTDTVSAIQDCV